MNRVLVVGSLHVRGASGLRTEAGAGGHVQHVRRRPEDHLPRSRDPDVHDWREDDPRRPRDGGRFYFFCSTHVVAVGPVPVTCSVTSPSFAQAKWLCPAGSVSTLPGGNTRVRGLYRAGAHRHSDRHEATAPRSTLGNRIEDAPTRRVASAASRGVSTREQD